MGMIIVNKQKFSFRQIKEGRWPEQAPYFEASLSFCREWLNGKNAFELQTSGSTGSPQTIKVSRVQMSSSAKATGDFFNIQPKASLLCCLNTAMIAGKMMLVRAMEWEGLLHLVEPSSNPLLGFAAEQTLDFATMVPLQLETCLDDEYSRRLVYRVQNLLIGGAPPSPALREKASKLPANVFQTYGMTETVSHIALADLKADGPLLYKSLPGVQLRQDQALRLEISAPMSNNAWITTNDIVEVYPEQGAFVWKGRADFTINSGGVKVQPEEVEALAEGVIKAFFQERRYLVTSLPDPKLGQKIILMIEGKKHNQDPEPVLKLLKAQLPAYHHPQAVYFVPRFAETASHKINRKRTLETWQALVESQQELSSD